MNSHSASDYVQASLAGALRAIICFPIEHPLEVIKTRLQTSPDKKTPAVVKEIFRHGYLSGARELYTGGTPNGLRSAVKQAYRIPMMKSIPAIYKKILPQKLQEKYPLAPNTLAAFTIANIETVFVSPLEKIKVELMTRPREEKGKLIAFYRENQGNLAKALMPGFRATYLRGVVSWVSFLYSDAKMKNFERKRTGSHELSFSSEMLVSFSVGLINTTIIMPLDIAKTILQKHRVQIDQTPDQRLLPVITAVWKNNGLKGVYTGFRIRIIQYMFHSYCTMKLVEGNINFSDLYARINSTYQSFLRTVFPEKN